jgi:hypothetical protein
MYRGSWGYQPKLARDITAHRCGPTWRCSRPAGSGDFAIQMRSKAFLIYRCCSFQPAAKRPPVGRHLDGTPSRSRTRLMVVHSNVMVCWRDLSQACRDEQRIRMRSCADLVSGNLIWSCPMHSNAKVCWRGLVKRIACEQASERQGVPGDLRQADCCMPVHRSIEQPPNQAL